MPEHLATCAWQRGEPCDCLRTRLRRQRDASTELRRQVADLTEERDLLARQLRAIRTVLDDGNREGYDDARDDLAAKVRQLVDICNILDGVAR